VDRRLLLAPERTHGGPCHARARGLSKRSAQQAAGLRRRLPRSEAEGAAKASLRLAGRLLIGLCLLLPAAEAAAEDLSVVSYNVHGLPAWIARDDPDARMPAIGRLLSRYDVALVQEVWGYQDSLAASVSHGLKLQGNAARSALLGALSLFCGSCGAGLSLYTDPPRERVLETAALAYNLCADWLFGANDCWATKGFVFARLRLASGSEVDVYDTHLEAGDGEDDRSVREAQLEKLQAFLAVRSAGRAVILGGDLNLAYDAAHPRGVVESFAKSLGLRDSGARPADLSRWKNRIDWILFRDGADVTLAASASGEDLDFVRDGAPLSDHPAVFTRFRVTRHTLPRDAEAVSPQDPAQVEMPPSTGITAPVTYEPARDAR
jgi:endonuclease/exonuclease/phosphatase family metal-dependent hydrolase